LSDTTWLPGSLFDNIDKFSNSLGYENSSIAIPLAMVSWGSPEERDLFIQAITGDTVKGGEEKTYITKPKG
jgi:hypothetical protein